MDSRTELTSILPENRVLTRVIDRIAYANDASYFRLVPQAVVQPNSLDEIRSLFKFSQKRRIPMTFRAAGTSLSGQAVSDGILVDISKHWGQYHVEEQGKLIRFQPGIVGGFLNNVLKPSHRRIGPDPASIDACMMGGILANNSSGMCCGVTENAYRTIHSMNFILPNGFTLDTSAKNAARIFESEQSHIAMGLLELKQRLLSDADLTARVRRRYQMKNNNGYLLNAFLDFDSPLDILIHLLIGSEGTLGFIAEGALYTLPDYPRKYTGQLYFKNIRDAASAIYPLKESGARAAEIMDRASLRSVEGVPGAPDLLHQLPESAAAILVEYQAETLEQILHFQNECVRTLKSLRLLHDAEFTEDPLRQAALWKLRKGIIPSVGAMRPPGTILLTEDVVFPVERLAAAITDLQGLFDEHGYPEGVVFGHAKDGNLHFLIAQSFDTASEVKRFAEFMNGLVRVVCHKYDGALKAEHGTGRNTAPFVETEWGAAAYAIMRDLKSLLDPDNMLNPGVVINPDPRAHITHVKSMAKVAPEVDKCIECGFCESKCPSRRLTLSPRQRIVVQREISRLHELESVAASRAGPFPSPSYSDLISSLSADFQYSGVDTCAVDGLCATACPVGINTGELTKQLRARSLSSRNEEAAIWVAKHFRWVESATGWAVRAGHFLENLQPRRHDSVKGNKSFLVSLSRAAEKITGWTLPEWNAYIPYPSKLRSTDSRNGEKQFIYFPSCISRQLGVPGSLGHGWSSSLSATMLTVAERANVRLTIPAAVTGTCCGMPFSSKGYVAAYQVTLHNAIKKFWEWSERGKYPVVIDTTSCTQTLRACYDSLSDADKELYNRLTFLDTIEFIHDALLPRLKIQPVPTDVILHPNCSARKLGLDSKMTVIAERCARSAAIPLHLGCCGFAGDRGLLFPELTASATAKEAEEVRAREYGGYYSSNITCEIGMSAATGREYRSVIYLVEQASRS
jgi:D-lactate dehydrogenase